MDLAIEIVALFVMTNLVTVIYSAIRNEDLVGYIGRVLFMNLITSIYVGTIIL